MAPKKRTSAKAAAPKTRARKKSAPAKKKTTRLAARTHTATIAHDRRYHTYADHRSDSYRHYASIMKTVILFLGFVLLLAIIANIFAPSINGRPASQSSQNFLGNNMAGDRTANGNSGMYKQYRYVTPENAQTTRTISPGSRSSQ